MSLFKMRIAGILVKNFTKLNETWYRIISYNRSKLWRKIMKRLIVLLVAAIIVFSGCASIMSGSTQAVSISSSPDNANVTIYDEHNMKVWDSSTPTVVNLKRGDGYFSGTSYRVEIAKEGYEKQTVQISSGLNGG
jgi:uncharacterized protein YceK